MATAAARLAAIEATLSPTQLVVRWLDEAHAHGSLEAYVGSLLDEPPERFPFTRLLREAKASVPRRSARSEDRDRAVRKALRETAFRFELVLGINIGTHELLDRETLRQVALTAHLALLAMGHGPDGKPDPTHQERLAQCLTIADWSVTELMASERARSIVEDRYLAGHAALFPDDAARFTEQVEETQRQTVLAMRLAELDGLEPAEPGHPDAVAKRAETLVDNLVEPARVTALEKLDEGRQAISIATDWLRRTTQPRPTDPAEPPTL